MQYNVAVVYIHKFTGCTTSRYGPDKFAKCLLLWHHALSNILTIITCIKCNFDVFVFNFEFVQNLDEHHNFSRRIKYLSSALEVAFKRHRAVTNTYLRNNNCLKNYFET